MSNTQGLRSKTERINVASGIRFRKKVALFKDITTDIYIIISIIR